MSTDNSILLKELAVQAFLLYIIFTGVVALLAHDQLIISANSQALTIFEAQSQGIASLTWELDHNPSKPLQANKVFVLKKKQAHLASEQAYALLELKSQLAHKPY
ncbi:hypothetical protein [Aliikangiella maris]|uniref:Uncharacterized protein n=2 Tax=Aliikangiella maris TaxID=3162458 RepID=A0ABV3MJ24_9GAMM